MNVRVLFIQFNDWGGSQRGTAGCEFENRSSQRNLSLPENDLPVAIKPIPAKDSVPKTPFLLLLKIIPLLFWVGQVTPLVSQTKN
jgi:hypothetical protein